MKLIQLFFLLLLAGCGGSKPATMIPQNLPGPSDCPYAFDSQNLCGAIQWNQGPTADGESTFVVNFWQRGGDPARIAAPQGEVTSFLRMTCCGSITDNAVRILPDGRFLVDKVKFSPGDWELYIRIKNGATEEKKSLPFHLD